MSIHPRLSKLLAVKNDANRDQLTKRRGHRSKEEYSADIKLKCTPKLKSKLADFCKQYHVAQGVVVRDAIEFYLSVAEMERAVERSDVSPEGVEPAETGQGSGVS